MQQMTRSCNKQCALKSKGALRPCVCCKLYDWSLQRKSVCVGGGGRGGGITEQI